jgi:hypothetical protein
MPGLTRRLQILVDDDRYERLRRASEESGAPVGELVRRAIDREFPAEPSDRAAAAAALLTLPAPKGREPDWAITKRKIREGLSYRGSS